MKNLIVSALVLFLVIGWVQQPKSKAPEQGYVPEGWSPHEGGLLKYRVAIRFGEEPDTMPDGWKFGRVSSVTTDSKGEVYVFQRGKKADPVVVFDAKAITCVPGDAVSSAIRTAFAPISTTTSGALITARIRSTNSHVTASFSSRSGSKAKPEPTTRPSISRPTSHGTRRETSTSQMATETHAWSSSIRTLSICSPGARLAA